MCDENDVLYFKGSKTYTNKDMENMAKICDAAHDQEFERLKAKFIELAEMGGMEKKYELFRYHRYNIHIEIILRVEYEMGEDELISVEFDGNDWTYLQGHCLRETFDDIQEAVGDLWDGIKSYVLQQDNDYGSVLAVGTDE